MNALQSVDLVQPNGEYVSGLVPVQEPSRAHGPDEEAVVRSTAMAFEDVDFVLFRRFADNRTSQPAAFVIDNSSQRLTEAQISRIHGDLWLHGVAPLLYIASPTRIDILSCARGPDFWQNDDYAFHPAAQIETAVDVERELRNQRRFSALRLTDGTFWDDPGNASLANRKKNAHELLIQAVVEVDEELDGAKHPVLRRLLLLMVLIKYLEDRRVFPSGWFGRFHKGARCFFDVLKAGEPDSVNRLLQTLERRFNGDVFELPETAHDGLSKTALRRFARLVEGRTIGQQRYLWEQYSFEHLPVEVISHLYDRFVEGHGAVYTPPFLASLILDFAMPYERLHGTERVLDPACGSGVFLVGAFRRLVNVWRSKNGWDRPGVKTLKQILEQCIFGVETDASAVDLTAFSLALAVCDALKPKVIWSDLRFDPLRGRNLFERDFFEFVLEQKNDDHTDGLGSFDVIVGNPPFESSLSDAGERVDAAAKEKRKRLPDKQAAYLFLEQGCAMLNRGGKLCLIQPHGFLYNRKVQNFRRSLLREYRIETVLDFVSIRNLYDAADPKTIAVQIVADDILRDHVITHLTFRRTYATKQRIGFEIDHYEWHSVPQALAEHDPLVWRINLLGGGRLADISNRLRSIRTLTTFVKEQGWLSGEGFIVGKRTQEAPFLTGKRYLPSSALTTDGITRDAMGVVTETHFQWPRTEELFQSPLVLIREHQSLPAVFWDKGDVAFKNEIVGINAPKPQRNALKQFFDTFQERLRQYQFCCTLNGTRALIGKATAILKSDIETLPYPTSEDELEFSFWETALQDDVLDYVAPFIRLGQNSALLKEAAGKDHLDAYAEVFCRLLSSIYENLTAAEPTFFDGLICQPFTFGDKPEVDWPGTEQAAALHQLVYNRLVESLRTVRVVRFYDKNVLLIIKPDRLRYWIRSTAVRDADDTLVELHQQGY